MLNQVVTKVVLSKVDPRAEGSHQQVGISEGFYYDHYEAADDREVLPDSPERDFVNYHLLRIIRDLYINSKDGGQSGAYRKQCRTKRKSALIAILDSSEEPGTFRWSCKALGYNPDEFRNRILFDVEETSALVRDGVRVNEGQRRNPLVEAEAWLWEEAPLRYQLSEKKGHGVIKMTKADAFAWMCSLEGSPLEFSIEAFDLTSGDIILIIRNK